MMMSEDGTGAPLDAADIAQYAAETGLTMPVLNDPQWAVGERYERDDAVPSLTLLSPGARLELVDEWVTEDDIVDALPR
jgi:hypothetical protein